MPADFSFLESISRIAESVTFCETQSIMENVYSLNDWRDNPADGSAFMLERTRKHDLEGNGLPNRA